jgi:hypothetical protein
VSLVVAALIAVAGTVVFVHGLEEALRTPINTYLRDRTLALLSETEAKGLSITFPVLDLRLAHRQLVIHDLRIRYDHRDSTRYVRFAAGTPKVTLDGLDLSDILWHRSLRLSAVHLEAPVVTQLRELPDTASSVPALAAIGDADSLRFDAPPLDSLIYNLVAAWLPEDFREARVDLIGLDRATVVSSTILGGKTAKDSIGDLSLQIRGLALDSLKRQVFESASILAGAWLHVARGRPDSLRFDSIAVRVDPEDTVVTVRRLRTTPVDSGAVLFLGGLRRSNRDRLLRVDTLAFEPALSDNDWLRRSPGRRSRLRVNASGIVASRISPATVLRQRVEVGLIVIRQFRLDVLTDQRGEIARPRARTLWPQSLARLGWRVRIDSIRVDQGLVQYGEVHPARSEPAVIWFSDISALVTGVSNGDSSGMAADPTVLAASARLMGTGRLKARLAVPIRPVGFEMSVQGQLSNFPLPALNRFVMTTDGIRLSSGRVTEVTFEFHTVSGRSTGRFQATYDSLNVEPIDKGTRNQGLLQKVKGFVANRILLRGENLPAKNGYRPTVPISYVLAGGDSFWGLTWKSIRTGIGAMMRR